MQARGSPTSGVYGRSASRQSLDVYVTLGVVAVGLSVAAIRADRSPVSDVDDLERSELVTKIDPNEASAAELGVLPGIGEALASRIVELRAHRRGVEGADRAFQCIEDLRAVRGIGPKSIEKLRPFLSFQE